MSVKKVKVVQKWLILACARTFAANSVNLRLFLFLKKIKISCFMFKGFKIVKKK